MGQAAVDLPEPLEQTRLDGTSSTDELLAQMAGDEIDRLLAEAEVERATPAASSEVDPVEESGDGAETAADAAETGPSAAAEPTPRLSGQAVAACGSDPDIVQQIDSLLTEPKGDEASAEALPRATASEAEDLDTNLSSQLDDLFKELTADSAAAPAPPAAQAEMPAPVATPAAGKAATPAAVEATEPAKPADAPAPVSAPAPATPSVAVLDVVDMHLPAAVPDGGTGSAEKAALTAEIPDFSQPPAAEPRSVRVESPPGLFIRFLQLVNAPLAHCGDGVRDVLGKVAITTLINALAILAYVMFFRR